MNAEQLKEYLKQVEDKAEIFRANLIELKNAETGEIVLAADSQNAFFIQKVVPSVRYLHGDAEDERRLGIHPVAKNLHESETSVRNLEIVQ